MLDAFTMQIDWCTRLGSPFTAQVLSVLADDLSDGGPTAGLVAGWPGDPVGDAVPLRLAGALHALALNGADPDLAACYPPRHAAAGADQLRGALHAALRGHDGFIRNFLGSPPQTNEVGRSAVLLGGFLVVAAMTRLPLRLLEVGASAGLNLIWDHYGYRIGPRFWGDPESPLVLAPDWHGHLPPLDAPLHVVERAACDRAPIDLADVEQRLRLRAYVWADQTARLDRLDAAMAVARRQGYAVERADAAGWVGARLAGPAADLARVIYHSFMWGYLPAASRARIGSDIEEAGRRAGEAAPLAWLRFEPAPPDDKPELRLTLWPGGKEHRLAAAHPHGDAMTWLHE